MTVKRDLLPGTQSPPGEDAALIAELAGKRFRSFPECETEAELLNHPARAAEVLELLSRSAAAADPPKQTPLAAAATLGEISNLLLRQPAKKTALKANPPTTRRWERGSGSGEAMTFVPSEDDVANAVEGSTHRSHCMLRIGACSAAVWAAIATWLLLWM